MRAQPVKRILVRLMAMSVMAVVGWNGRFCRWHPGTAAEVIDKFVYRLFSWSTQRKFQVRGGILFSWEKW